MAPRYERVVTDPGLVGCNAPMSPQRSRRSPISVAAGVLAALFLAMPASATHGGPHVTLEPDTKGCTGILPSSDGNTDMLVIGGTMEPGGTAIFEISYPLNPGSVGKEFTIIDCAFINDVATLRYTISFVPSNEAFVLRMTLAVPADAPVGGLYCNYVKTTGSPTAAQASQRKAGPACFVIRPPSRTTVATPPPPPAPAPVPPTRAPSAPVASPPPSSAGTVIVVPRPAGPILLPDTAMAPAGSDRALRTSVALRAPVAR